MGVEILVLIESPHQETQKECLLRLSADDKQLQQARKEFASGQWVELGNNDELDELLKTKKLIRRCLSPKRKR
ncbi:MAG: hypothetical protein KAI83_16365 [Thiomargarita sp.]|nr:hypothetical protein [Thiomargarita sp.]